MPLSAAIFRRGGPKRELFDEGDDAGIVQDVDDETELQVKLKQVRELLASDKSGKELSAAIWRPQLRLAELVLTRKNTAYNMGFIHGKKNFLHVEEAVFLVDRADLLLFVDQPDGSQHLLSLQEAYDLMLEECPGGMDVYILYTFLQRAGYIVRRHPTRWVLDLQEDPANVWGSAAWRLVPRQQDPNDDPALSAVLDALRAECTDDQCCAELEAISAGAQLQRGAGCAASPSDQANGRHQRHWWRKADPSHPHLSGIPQSFFDYPPPGVPGPLPNPGDTLRQQFPHLQPFGPIPPDVQLGPLSSAAYLLFDVYKPGAHLARRAAVFPPIAFHLSLSHGAPPTLQDMHAADAQAAAAAAGIPTNAGSGGDAPQGEQRVPTPAAPVKYAKVESGDITFYGITKMSILQLF